MLTGPIFKDQNFKKVHKSTKTFFIKELSPLFIHSEYVQWSVPHILGKDNFRSSLSDPNMPAARMHQLLSCFSTRPDSDLVSQGGFPQISISPLDQYQHASFTNASTFVLFLNSPQQRLGYIGRNTIRNKVNFVQTYVTQVLQSELPYPLINFQSRNP